MSDRIKNLEAVLQNANTPQDKIDALNELGWALRRDDFTRTIELAQQTQKLAQQEPFTPIPYHKGFANGLINEAGANLYRANFGVTLSKSLEAVSILEQHNIRESLPRALYLVSVAYGQLGNVSDALDFSFRQLHVSDELEDLEGRATALLVIGAHYDDMGNYKESLNYLTQCLDAFKKLDKTYWVILSYCNVSEVTRKLGDPQKGLEHALTALSIANNSSQQTSHRINQLIYIKIGEAHMALNQLDEALKHMQAAIDYAKDVEDPETAIQAMQSIAQLYFRLNEYDKSLAYVQSALEWAQKIKHTAHIYRGHELLADIYEKQNDPTQALYHYRQFHIVKESMINEESKQQLENLQVIYRTETAQKEAEYYASLYEAEQARRELESILNQIGRILTSTLNLNEVLDQILAQLNKLLSFDRGSLLLWRTGELEFVATRGYDSANTPPDQHRIPVDLDNDQDVFSRIYKSQDPLAIEDVTQYDGWQRVEGLTTPGSWLGLPLIRGQEVTGMLSLARNEVKPYDDEDISIATTFASQAVIALENARLYNQVQQFNQYLEDEVQKRTVALQEAYQQLERLDRNKADFIAVTAHELRTPITILKGYGQILENDPSVRSDDYRNNLVSGIVSGANRLYEIVNTMLTMVKINNQSLEMNPETLSIFQLLDAVVVNLENDISDRQQTVTLDEDNLRQLPVIEGDISTLKTVFSNIVMNAIKYTPDHGQIHIHGTSWQAPPTPHLPANAIQITISDTGIGINAEALELIFDKFYQTGEVATHSSGRTKFKGGGPGLGLAIARGIIESHHGHLWAESPGHDEINCPGSDFHVILPIKQTRPQNQTTLTPA